MSFLVRGMEMPKSCKECFFLKYGNFKLFCALTFEDLTFSLPRSCPLVELPPHGWLIDADALKETIEALIEKHLHGYTKSTWDFVCELRRIISDAPTIIPAEPAEEG